MQMLAHLANEAWAMEPEALRGFLASVEAIDPALAARLDFDDAEAPTYAIRGSVAHIPISGVLLKSVPPILRAFGIEATGYTEIAQMIAAAESDQRIARVVFTVDSPGGQVSGVQALADRIHGMTKPTSAHVDGMAASAAYWLASQADEITAPRSAEVGSIGAYIVMYDRSQAAAAAGVKVLVIASGPHKGTGVPGAPITAEQQAEIQGRIDAIATLFVEDIARGRSMDAPQIRALADGRVYTSAVAQANGLIDRVSADPEREQQTMENQTAALALVGKHPAHAALIAGRALAGDDANAIESAIIAADRAAADKVAADHVAKIEADNAKLAAHVAAIEVELKAANEKLAAAEAKSAALAALRDGAVGAASVRPDPAASHVKHTFSRDDAAAGRIPADVLKSGDYAIDA